MSKTSKLYHEGVKEYIKTLEESLRYHSQNILKTMIRTEPDNMSLANEAAKLLHYSLRNPVELNGVCDKLRKHINEVKLNNYQRVLNQLHIVKRGI